ncbi:molybdopterin-guanine dinucleotide biosynthesis protein B [Cupriavidus sp. CV2]|uniref:molybdopterin-guanine dinucleotide biosynthesis protein B n=1 Tax=Cupriavidus TaxID=106589 RepID=UPI00296A9628|nr:molybdopterin-guanine dinucleotide biosynthesis protein B [Cupriavidus sp. CV2]MDW3687004.1 molybdopterin-guanine dinucleotide biosynthesis protein B [Cupriavidus sp. CV2]
MKVFGISGTSGSGKTTLLDQLIPRFVAAGLRVAGVKHTHHGFDPDTPGKDSWRMRQAGCANVVLVGARHLTLMRHYPEAEASPELADALAVLPADTDLVLVEGYKRSDFPKLEVFRPDLGTPPLWPEVPSIMAVASDQPQAVAALTALPVLDLADLDAICQLIRDSALELTPALAAALAQPHQTR